MSSRSVPATSARSRGALYLAVLPVLCALFALSSCTSLKQYRTVTVVDDATEDAASKVRDQICSAESPNDPSDDCALERRTYRYEGEEHDYYFATVEFDDQGWFWDRRQMEMLLRLLYEHRDDDGEASEYLLFVHAHGWQHNANACDNNVVCFQRLLERMDLSERSFVDAYLASNPQGDRKPRKIVGIYVAWRGASGTIPTVRATTFWARKRAARRVGIGGVFELLSRLDDFRSFKNWSHEGSKTQLIISGHSFGGQIIYKALAQNLIERATHMENGQFDDDIDAPYGYDIASSFGDLVILVNPAFEGAAYESLQSVATRRCYSEKQWPAMLVVTSDADDATRRVFPFGRFLSNMATRSRCQRQRKAVLHTVGHLESYRTHNLVVKDAPPGTVEPPQERRDGPCGCPYLGPTEEFERDDEDLAFYTALDHIDKARRRAEARGGSKAYEVGLPDGVDSLDELRDISYGPDLSGGKMVLERSPEYAANYPYLVISTDAAFIPDHSTIYGERFTDFLRRFYFRHLAEKLSFPAQCFDNTNPDCLDTDITPCEVSWKGALAYECPPESFEER